MQNMFCSKPIHELERSIGQNAGLMVDGVNVEVIRLPQRPCLQTCDGLDADWQTFKRDADWQRFKRDAEGLRSTLPSIGVESMEVFD